MELEASQAPATSTIPCLQDQFQCYPPIYAWVFHVVTFPKVLQLPYLLHAPAIPSSLTLSP